ncbi:M20/M25/M40 family metallo-hydrolase [Candidatus Hodarchaeum mangrovi]
MPTIDEMDNYLRINNDLHINNLFKLVQIPTVTAKGGNNSLQAIKILESIFKPLDFKTNIFKTKGQPVFTALYDANQPKTLLFYNHYDVQPAEPYDLWISPPFEPEIRNGKIYGRGVADNKGEIIVRASAVKMMLDLKEKLPINVKFIIEGEEEVSSPHLKDFVTSNPEYMKANACIWEFGGKNAIGQQEIWAGVKGICYVQLKTTGPKKDLHSALGAVVHNPANHLVAALASLRDDKTDKILLENFYENIIQPTEEYNIAISRIKESFNEDKQKEAWGIDQFILNLKGEELLHKYYLSPTCTICGIWSGWQGDGGKTVLPAIAQAKVDFRLVPHQTPEDVVLKLKQHFEKNDFNIEIEWYEGYKPAYTPLDNPFVKVVKKTISEIYLHEPILHPWNPGSGPLYLFTEHLPVLSIGVGNPASNSHSPNENIEVNDFLRGQKCIARLMENIAKS